MSAEHPERTARQLELTLESPLDEPQRVCRLVIEPPVATLDDAASALALAQRLGRALGDRLSERLRLRIHDNRSVAVSFQRDAVLIDARVHRLFLNAPDETIAALGEYIRTSSPGAARLLDAHLARQSTAPQIVASSQGTVHDLEGIFDQLNASYFSQEIDATIGWGHGRFLSPHARLGAYCDISRTITIHPRLDSIDIPAFFVSFVIYHEMLHQAVPPLVERSGRRLLHPPEFRRRERLHPKWREARHYARNELRAPKNEWQDSEGSPRSDALQEDSFPGRIVDLSLRAR